MCQDAFVRTFLHAVSTAPTSRPRASYFLGGNALRYAFPRTCSLDLAPQALAKMAGVPHAPFTTPARVFHDALWQCANTPFSMAILQCVVVNMVNSCVGMTYSNALRLNGAWLAARLLTSWPQWGAALAWGRASHGEDREWAGAPRFGFGGFGCCDVDII